MTSPTNVPSPGASRPPTRSVTVNANLHDASLDVMNFLNEIAEAYPRAISFAPGRPLESLFHVEDHLAHLTEAVSDTAAQQGTRPEAVWQALGQYARTNGTIADVIAEQLRIDEKIDVVPEAIMVTVGAQEAMAVLLAGLFDPAKDVLLVSDPAYVGISGLARLLGIAIAPVPVEDDHGLNPVVVEQAIAAASRQGRIVALYTSANFSNPLGYSLSHQRRLDLLDVCARHGVVILEDDAYGMFAYDEPRRPSLKALDRRGDVIYIGSFAKTIFPGLRIGYLVADQQVPPANIPLAKMLSKVKSLVTVNTPPLLQAMVSAALRRTGGSLEPWVAPKRDKYRRQRDAMLAALQRELQDTPVTWNRPSGGFFLTVTLPFEFGPEELRLCAEVHGVVVTPMRCFCLACRRLTQVRLAFTYVEEPAIDEGVRRFARFVRERLRSGVERTAVGSSR